MRLAATSTLAVIALAASLAACTKAPEERNLPPGPGNGATTCPGNASCPEDTHYAQGDTRNSDDRMYYGIAVAAADVPPPGQDGKPKQMICTGVEATSTPGCPKGYVGRLVLAAHVPQPLILCQPGSRAPCKPDTWAIVCRNDNYPRAPKKACASLPALAIPGYDPE